MKPTTLLLSVNYEPLRVIPTKRAVLLVLQEKAEVLEADDEVWRSAHTKIRIPKVIRLTYFVRIPYRARIPLKRAAVLARDNHTCAYCGGHATTIDHVKPRAAGGLHRWENVVAACSRCNFRKGSKSLDEMGWSLPFTPFAPTGIRWLLIGVAEADPVWEPYLGQAA